MLPWEPTEGTVYKGLARGPRLLHTGLWVLSVTQDSKKRSIIPILLLRKQVYREFKTPARSSIFPQRMWPSLYVCEQNSTTNGPQYAWGLFYEFGLGCVPSSSVPPRNRVVVCPMALQSFPLNRRRELLCPVAPRLGLRLALTSGNQWA